MPLFIESIKLLDGVFFRLDFHQERINGIFNQFFPGKDKILLTELIKNQVYPENGLFKMRILFDSNVSQIEPVPYQLPIIQSLKIIETDILTTFYKSADREKINVAFAKKEDCDDILFVKNGLVTDTSYCNTAFFDGKNWFTPKTPLIYGIQRQNLLISDLLREKDISIDDVSSYQSVCLFNAMIEFGEIIIPTKAIKG